MFSKKCFLKYLPQRFLNFFLEKYKRHVCNTDQWEFVNGWYVLVIISDLMTIVGSILKMEIKVKVRGSPLKICCSSRSSRRGSVVDESD